MAKVVCSMYSDAKGPIFVPLDVTPTWWPRARSGAYGPVVACITKGAKFCRMISIGPSSVHIERALIIGEDFGAALQALRDAVEALGSEYAYPAEPAATP